MTARGTWAAVVAGAVLLVGAPVAHAYVEATLRAAAEISVASLGTPDAAVVRDGALVTVRPVPPAEGPEPDRYEVRRRVAGDEVVVCADVAPFGACPDHDAAMIDPADVQYVVTARLGEHWRRDSLPVAAPAPRGAGGDEPAGPVARLDPPTEEASADVGAPGPGSPSSGSLPPPDVPAADDDLDDHGDQRGRRPDAVSPGAPLPGAVPLAGDAVG